jgi:glycerophosphoryl diester phosphodiesterase
MYYLQRLILGLVDFVCMLVPRRRPTREAMAQCRIVSHRGEHNNRSVRENTFAAFAPVAEAGCWGLEFDLRWTRDLQPVVIHDADTERVFGIKLVVAEVSLAELRQRIPEVPTLVEVVERFGGRQHLMIELKRDRLGSVAARRERLREALASLEPVADYHFLALHPQSFELAGFAGGRACVPVAEFNLADLSRLALRQEYGGVCAHYLLMSRKVIERHHRQGQLVGSGFASSRNCLYREINRGVDWIFSNHALKVEAIRRKLLSR